MKNNLIKILYIALIFLFNSNLFADELDIKANQLNLNKETKRILAEGNVQISDLKKNIIFAEKAEYDKSKELMRSFGPTDIITSEKFRIQGEDIFYDNKKGVIYSETNTIVTDINGNQIYLNMFDYSIEKKMYFSQGNIEVLDSKSLSLIHI